MFGKIHRANVACDFRNGYANPMSVLSRNGILWAGAFLSYGVLLTVRLMNWDTLGRFLIPIFVLLVLVVAIRVPGGLGAQRKLLITALSAALVGDLLVNWSPVPGWCLLPFAITHLSLFALCVHLRAFSVFDLLILPAVATVAWIFHLAMAPHMPSTVTWLAAIFYQVLLVMVCWRALCLWQSPQTVAKKLLASGIVLFFFTDHFVMMQIVTPATHWVLLTWLCYPPALFLIAQSSTYFTPHQGST